MYKLTVVTTTYNHEKFIRDAIEGIVKQKTNFAFKLIISDDLSTDDTRKIIKEYATKYPNIVIPIFNKKNLGSMENFIQTLSLADTEYVALCDGDDFWTDENKLQKQVDFLDKNPDFSICFHKIKIFYEDGSQKDSIHPTNIKTITKFEDLLKDCYIPANSVVYRWNFKKGNLSKIFPRDIVPGDYFVHLLHASVGKINFIDETMSSYRRHDQGMWWLTSKPELQDEFNMKYGMKYLNFFIFIEKYFKLSDTTFKIQKEYLAFNILRTYYKKSDLSSIENYKKKFPEYYRKYIDEVSFEPAYSNRGFVYKVFTLFFFRPKIFFQKLLNKLQEIIKK